MRTGYLLKGTMAALLALAVAGMVGAQEKPPVAVGPQPVLEPLLPTAPPVDESMALAPGSPERGQPAAAPAGEDGFFLNAEFLYLKPRVRTLDFALTAPVADGTTQGTIVSLDYESRPGLRAGGGYRLAEGWELGFAYTYLHSATGGQTAAPPGGTVFATLTDPAGFVQQVDTAVAASSVNYNVFDLELAHRFQACDSLGLRVVGGGRFAWIDQNATVFYDGGDASLDQVSSRFNFGGGGLRCGADGDWQIGWGFGVYGKAYGSLLAGTSTIHQGETNNAGATVINAVSQKFQNVIPVAELSMGVAWQFNNLHLRLGYEFTNWFDLIETPDFTSDFQQGKFQRRTSSLSLDGLVLQALYEF